MDLRGAARRRRAVAGALLERFEPGERVAVWAPNIPEWILLELGAGLAGIVLVTVNPAYKPKELDYVLRQSGAAGIFLVPEFRGNPMAASLEEVRPTLPSLREAIRFDDWDAFLGVVPGVAPAPRRAAGDPAQIQYTSGTTGFPKGALLHHRGLTNNARIFATLTGLRARRHLRQPVPDVPHRRLRARRARHAAGRGLPRARLRVRPVADARADRDRAGRHRPRRADRPAGAARVPRPPERDVSRVRVVLSGGATVPADLVRRVETTFGCQFSIIYGTTECSPLLTQVRLDDDFVDKTETLGRPVPQTEIKIVGPDTGEVLPCGEVGELCARGYCVMTGYYDMPEQTAAAIDAEGWYHTGDLASMDDRGFLRIEGRLKDMIIRGGENIYPREIEDLLFEHPKVAEVAVVGVPDERWGEAVAAFVRSAPGEAPTAEELFAYCREHLAAPKTPRHWGFVDAFPLTASGKIQKFVLRDGFVG